MYSFSPHPFPLKIALGPCEDTAAWAECSTIMIGPRDAAHSSFWTTRPWPLVLCPQSVLMTGMQHGENELADYVDLPG
jgi:hypothetical protein